MLSLARLQKKLKRFSLSYQYKILVFASSASGGCSTVPKPLMSLLQCFAWTSLD